MAEEHLPSNCGQILCVLYQCTAAVIQLAIDGELVIFGSEN